MNESDANRSFAVPVFFLLAGLVLVMLAVAWIAYGTEPFIDDDLATQPTTSRPWLPAIATVLAVGTLWWGFRKLRQPKQ